MEQQNWEGNQLDKDFLATESPGKLYSPETCCFVPSWLNSLFTDSAAKRGEWPQGVYWHKHGQRFGVKLRVDGRQKHLGYFSTPHEAFNAYVQAKVNCTLKKLATFQHPLRDRIEDGAIRQLKALTAEARAYAKSTSLERDLITCSN